MWLSFSGWSFPSKTPAFLFTYCFVLVPKALSCPISWEPTGQDCLRTIRPLKQTGELQYLLSSPFLQIQPHSLTPLLYSRIPVVASPHSLHPFPGDEANPVWVCSLLSCGPTQPFPSNLSPFLKINIQRIGIHCTKNVQGPDLAGPQENSLPGKTNPPHPLKNWKGNRNQVSKHPTKTRPAVNRR